MIRRNRTVLQVAVACVLGAWLLSSTATVLLLHCDGGSSWMHNMSSSSSLLSQQSAPFRSLLTPEQTYQSALLTLRCLTTPGCFLSLSCRQGVPQAVPRRKKWEEQAFCVQDLQQYGDDEACLVYSFGIHTSWEWEEKVAALFGCRVYAFDPTMDHPAELAPGVTFHQLGLQGAGTNMSATHSAEYTAIDSKRLLPLDQIMQRLGHGGRNLNLLMLDCEGCEWGVLQQMMCNSEKTVAVDQIVVEMHFQKNLGLWNEADVLAAAQAVVCLEQARWGIVSIETSGIGKEDADYARDVTKVLHGTMGAFLLNIALERIPDEEPLPSERIESIASFSKGWAREREACFEKYGEKTREWPREACPEFRALDKEIFSKVRKYQAVTKDRVQFDKPSRLDESTFKFQTLREPA